MNASTLVGNSSFGSLLSTSNITVSDIYFHWYVYKLTVPLLFGFITLAGLVGNLLVVFVILSKRIMRNIVNLLLLNLAVSDILFLTISVPFVTYHYAADSWRIPEFFCKLWQFVLSVTVYITVYTLVAISIFRYLTIALAPKTAQLRTNRNVILLITLLWVVMLSVNIPILFSYRVKEYPIGYRYCAVENGWQVNLTFFIFSYVVPFVLIATFYSLLMHYLRRNRKNSSLRSSNRSASSEERGRERMNYASRIVLVVVAVFGISWFPLHVSLLWAHHGSQPDSRAYELFRVMSRCLAYGNSCMNPIIYNYVSKDFRKRFKDIWVSCVKVFSMSHSGESHVLNTYDYKNENATCNGGTSSGCHGEDTTKQSELKVPLEVERTSSSGGEEPRERMSSSAGVELLYVTKRHSNGIPVTDL